MVERGCRYEGKAANCSRPESARVPGKNEVRLVQMWVVPDTERIAPGYEQLDISANLKNGGLIPIASGRRHEGAISIRQKGAVLWGGRLRAGEVVSVPDAAYAHVYVAKGSVNLEEAGVLNEGDAARLTAAGGRKLTADSKTGAEVLIWEMTAE
jgi:redox-sensitive bicupin YhaK (pirin superfamily)